jgi:hypothetical protein
MVEVDEDVIDDDDVDGDVSIAMVRSGSGGSTRWRKTTRGSPCSSWLRWNRRKVVAQAARVRVQVAAAAAARDGSGSCGVRVRGESGEGGGRE